jgi:methionine synthase II (cobalamin-independent)
MPLASAEEVFITSAAILGPRAKRLSDGEVGITKNWILGHHRVFEQCAAFTAYDHIEQFDPRVRNIKRRRFRLRPDAQLDQTSFPPIGYAEDVRNAYRIFSDLKRKGTIAGETKLLCAMPTPYDVLNFVVDESDYPRVAPVYERLMLAEVDAILRDIPHNELAIQWDAAHEFEFLATTSRMFHVITPEQIIELLTRLGQHIPASAELGYHCCYGNFNLKHFVEPRDTADMVEIMNAVLDKLSRPVQFIHMPVPRHRQDEAYFAPLKTLRLPPETELYLGLIHDSDGVEGALGRAAAAKMAINKFGIATECGLAMRSPENIRQILKIEAATAARLGA